MSGNDFSGARWRKSSYSDGQANCIEVATIGSRHGLVAIRDSKAPDGPSLTFAPEAWRQFTARMTAGHQEA
jgi:hypothetical protein